MLVVAKKPRIKVSVGGKGMRIIIKLIKEKFPDAEIKKDDDEYVSVKDTDWYKDISKEMSPGKALRVFRENAGLTMMELSEKSGIAQSHLSDMEKSKRNIGKISAQKLGKALHRSYKSFL